MNDVDGMQVVGYEMIAENVFIEFLYETMGSIKVNKA